MRTFVYVLHFVTIASAILKATKMASPGQIFPRLSESMSQTAISTVKKTKKATDKYRTRSMVEKFVVYMNPDVVTIGIEFIPFLL